MTRQAVLQNSAALSLPPTRPCLEDPFVSLIVKRLISALNACDASALSTRLRTIFVVPWMQFYSPLKQLDKRPQEPQGDILVCILLRRQSY